MSCGSSEWEASENDTLYIFILKDRCLGERVECVCIEIENELREKGKKIKRTKIKKSKKGRKRVNKT
jgi:hypothetical protein